MDKTMLINTVEGQECRIAIVNDGVLEELYMERVSSASHVGNIYKGRITNVEPSIQAAFVDFGLTKNGFLHISDVHPQYFPKGQRAGESVGRKRSHRDRPPIQGCLRRGQEIVVQMTKEGIGTKGPTLTTYLSIPGRLLVMMPGMSRMGVSRKIEDEEARAKARQLLGELSVPADMGFIVRTAGADRNKRELQRDLKYLTRLWQSVSQRTKQSKAPAGIYQESDLITRTIRDVYNSDIHRVVCDSRAVGFKVKEFLDVAMPRGKHVIELYQGKEGLFHDFGLEHEIEKIYSRRVKLPSGASLVIDQTEALVAIDVNSGRFREHTDAENTAMRVNLEAAKEIARQLSLRDLGGVVIIDFIDMREDSSRRSVEKTLREALRNDRARTKLLRISNLGIVEMTRQRIGPSLKSSFYQACACCGGMGLIKSEESQALLVMRSLQRACAAEEVACAAVTVTPSVAHHLANFERRQIARLESESGKTIVVEADASLAGDEMRLTCRNARGSEVLIEPGPSSKTGPKKLDVINIEQLTPLPASQQDAGGEQSQATRPADKTPDTADIMAEQGVVSGPTIADRAAEDQGEPKKEAKPSRRRGKRGGKKHKRSGGRSASTDAEAPAQQPPDAVEAPATGDTDNGQAEPAPAEAAGSDERPVAKKTRRRGSRRPRKRKPSAASAAAAEGTGEDAVSSDEAKPAQPGKAEKPDES